MPEVVIVDSKGAEHVFPDGFDPKQAAEIVRSGAGKERGFFGQAEDAVVAGGKTFGSDLLEQAKALPGMLQSVFQPGHPDSINRAMEMGQGAKALWDNPGATKQLAIGDPNASMGTKIGTGLGHAASFLLPVKGAKLMKGLRGGSSAAKAVAELQAAEEAASLAKVSNTGFKAGGSVPSAMPFSASVKPSTVPEVSRLAAPIRVQPGASVPPAMGFSMPAAKSVPNKVGPVAPSALEAEFGMTMPERRLTANAADFKGVERRGVSNAERAADIRAEIPDIDKKAALMGKVTKEARTPSTPLEGTGFTPGKKTITLEEQVASKGLERTAKDAGMPVWELKARLASGGDTDKLAKLLLKDQGATRTNRTLGTNFESTKTLPAAKVAEIKAADARYTASGETPPAGHQALMDRIKGEGGAISKKLLYPIAGASVGAAAGPVMFGGEDAPLGKAIVGGVGGLALGTTIANPAKVGNTLLNARNQSWLSGGAIPKNLAAAGGGAVRASVEDLGSSRLAPLKEALRLPTNAKEWWKGTAHMLEGTDPLATPLAKAKNTWQRLRPTNIIGGVDTSASKMLARAGVSEDDVKRLLLTRNRNIFKGGFKDLEKYPNRLGSIDPKIQKVTEWLFPFQRVPTNVLAEGLQEASHMVNKPLSARGALNLAQVAGGYQLGKHSKDSPRNRLLSLILLAGAGPNTLAATLGMVAGTGGQGSRLLGGLSPIPEIEVPHDVKSAGRAAGIPPSAYYAYKKIVENK